MGNSDHGTTYMRVGGDETVHQIERHVQHRVEGVHVESAAEDWRGSPREERAS